MIHFYETPDIIVFASVTQCTSCSDRISVVKYFILGYYMCILKGSFGLKLRISD